MLRCLIVATIVGSTSAFTAGISPVLAGGSGSRLAGVASAPSRGAKLSALRMAAAGGAEAKGKLMKLLGEAGLGKGETEEQIREIDSLVDELSKEGTKFTRQVADGEWALVLSRNSKGSPKLQKASNKAEKVGTSFANFDCSQDKFFNIAEVFGGKGTLKATVAFGEMTDDKKRISCDIVDASIKLWKLPTIPLPLRAKGGWLDFLYLDEDMRITRGNRGGLFVHVRPSLVSQVRP